MSDWSSDVCSSDLTRIRALAVYEILEHEVIATEADLRTHLFGVRPYAEALIAECKGEAAGFALYFHNYSTFLAKPGLYLEDLFVQPAQRGKGIGKRLLAELAQIGIARGCGRFEWTGLDWKIGRASFRERVCPYVEIWVVAVSLTKKKRQINR